MRLAPIKTTESLKDHVEGKGLLCLTLKPGDYIAIGASIFIGFSQTKGEAARITLITPESDDIQRFLYRPHPLDR